MLPSDSGASPHSDGTDNICQRKKNKVEVVVGEWKKIKK